MPGHQLRRHRLGRSALPPVPSPNSGGTLRPQPRSKTTRAAEMNSRSSSYRSMPLSSVQKGAIGQYAFLSTAMVTGNGQVEAYTPAADNEGRDAEIRRHLKSLPGIGIQVKVTFFAIPEDRSRGPYLTIRFAIALAHLRTDPRLWFFFGYYNPKELRFQDPVFLIPSTV